MRLNHCYTLPPPREFLLEVAREKNSIPMPLINERFGIRLPPDRFCLTATNIQLSRKDRFPHKDIPIKEIKIPQSMPTLDSIVQSTVATEQTSTTEFAPFQSTVTEMIPPPPPPPPLPPQMSMKSLKRRHEEDYDEI